MREDSEAYFGLMALEDYQPANPTFSKETMTQHYQVMLTAVEAEVNAANALAAARDTAVAAEWDFHNAMLGAKAQVVAQYGDDSDQVQSLGMKKKSEYRRPARSVEG